MEKVKKRKLNKAEKPKKPGFGKTLGPLFKFLKEYKLLVAVAIILALGGIALQILVPYYLNDLMTRMAAVSGNPIEGIPGVPLNMSAVTRLGIMLGSFALGGVLLSYLQAHIMVWVAQKVVLRLRTRIIKKIKNMPLNYFDKSSFGDVLSRLTNDVTLIGEWLGHLIITVITSFSMLIAVTAVMFSISWIMTIAAVGATLIGIGIMVIMLKFGQKYFIAQQKYLGELNGKVEEGYNALNVIRVYNAKKEKQDDFNNTNKILEKNVAKANLFMASMPPLMGFIGNLGYAAVCVAGGLMITTGAVPMAEGFGLIASFMIFARLFSQPLMQMGEASQGLQLVGSASGRIFEFLNEKELEKEEAVFEETGQPIRGAVSFKNVKFGYEPDKTIIKNFSVDIKAGQKVAIVGPTGAGKTTLVNLLMRFYEIDSGDILIDGVSISSLTRKQVRNIFGMVLQDTWLFEGTIGDNILFNQGEGLSKEERLKKLEEAAELANLDHYIKTLPLGFDTVLDEKTSISGGQKQLITIARAFVSQRPMLILDEATSSVDTRTEILIQEAMERLTKGHTSFVIAHRLSTIKNADVILVLKDGDIVEKGTHEGLLKQNGFYAELYNSQFANNDSSFNE